MKHAQIEAKRFQQKNGNDDHLDIFFSDQQDFKESTLVLHIPRYFGPHPDVSKIPGPLITFLR